MPDLSDSALFPAFGALPPALVGSGSDPTTSAASSSSSNWVLLAQVKENMTITKPTLIVTDRTGVDFAVMFEDARVSLKGFRKGYTMVIPAARRTDKGEGKKAIVRIEEGGDAGVRVIPGSLEQVFELAKVAESDAVGQQCAACGKADGPLMKCTGCSTAAYCSKGCQVKGWSDLGHKSNCKALKSIREIWTSHN